MRHLAKLTIMITVSLFTVSLLGAAALAWEPPDPRTYLPTYTELEKAKAFFDDQRSMYTGSLAHKKVLPKDLYEKLVFPVDEMQKEWADVVGFKAPDLVGQKCPEVKPGKYTYQDVQKIACFKDLFYPPMLSRIKPGGPPHAGNIPEFEIVPTQQWYHALPVARATKANLSKTKTDGKGHLIPASWEAGYPFPRPSGPNKALQVMYNWEKRYTAWDQSYYEYGRVGGYRKDLSQDHFDWFEARAVKARGRLAMEPYGFLDERAKKRGEQRAYTLLFLGPRDLAGMALSSLYYHEDRPDLLMVYVPQLRRIRMMTSSDSQDPLSGQDVIYDDNDGFSQKLNASRFPYEWKVLEETEYLVQVPDGTEYITQKGLEIRNVKVMRRPIYVIEGKQLDNNYVYSKRIFYVDRETFMLCDVVNFDQKGRVYRSYNRPLKFESTMGVFHMGTILNFRDHVDLHSNVGLEYYLPASWGRRDLSIDQHLGLK